MENIVQPLSAAPSQARAPNEAASGGKDEGTAGLFGLLLSAQTATGDTPNGIGKKAAENCTDPMASLLISALMQGSIFFQNSAQQGTSENNSEQVTTALSATPESGVSSASALLALVDQKTADSAGKLSDGDLQFFTQLKALLSQTGDSGELQGQLAGQGGKLEALLQALPSAAPDADDSSAATSQTGTQALEEIRQLFTELVTAGQDLPSVPQQQNGAAAAPKTGEQVSATQDTATPQQVSQPQGALFQVTPATQPDDGKASSGSQEGLLSGKTGGKAASTVKRAAEDKTGTQDFQAVVKAAQSQPETQAAHERGKTEAVAAQKAFDSIVDRITSMTSSSQKEMEISLKPDFLGKVVIKLSLDDGGSLVAKIQASNPKVQETMMNQASALQSSLEAQGLKDVRVVVTSTMVPDASLQQQADRRGQGEGSRNKRNTVVVNAAEGTESASAPLSAYEQAYRTGSINYLA